MLPALFFVPLPRGTAVWLLFATALVHALYELFLVKSYESAAFSAVYPVARGTGPVFTTLGTIFSCTSIRRRCSSRYRADLRRRHRDRHLPSGQQRQPRGLAFALLTGLTIGCYTLIDASGVRAVAQPLSYVLWFFVAHGACVLVTAPGIRGRAVVVEARRQWKLGICAGAVVDHHLRLGNAGLACFLLNMNFGSII